MRIQYQNTARILVVHVMFAMIKMYFSSFLWLAVSLLTTLFSYILCVCIIKYIKIRKINKFTSKQMQNEIQFHEQVRLTDTQMYFVIRKHVRKKGIFHTVYKK